MTQPGPHLDTEKDAERVKMRKINSVVRNTTVYHAVKRRSTVSTPRDTVKAILCTVVDDRKMPTTESYEDYWLKKALEDVKWTEVGSSLRRVKRGSLRQPTHVSIQELRYFNYYSRFFFNFLPNKLKSVEVCDLLEVRSGYKTDNLHKASRKYEFQERAPEETCFSVIFTHAKFLHKSVDFSAESKEIRDRWVNALGYLITTAKEQRAQFNEKAWLLEQFHKADTNRNGKLSFGEIWELLKKLNLQLSEKYAKTVFSESDIVKKDGTLDEEEFLKFFNMLTDRPDLAHVLRSYSEAGIESWNSSELYRFLTEEQNFSDVTENKAESILETFEGVQQDSQKEKVMGIVGVRRLLQSRWGNILKPGHESVFQDMDQTLSHYFCSSSHNTYLTGLQLKGEATVEGYISALKKGARLLELDLFDGDHGEPVITHKRTLITPVTLRHTLEAIKRCAFETSPYPVILTIENHVGLVQQKVMAEVFKEILGDQLYVSGRDSGKHPLPSPNQLKRKILLRGKKIITSDDVDDDEEPDTPDSGKEKPAHNLPLDPSFSAIISLPSVKLNTSNVYADIKNHPLDGSPSLSETKVATLFEAGTPLFAYTVERFVKSYPKGLRQDSSNMHPMHSWLCGVQSVAMNFQTAGEELDLNNGLFRINGNCGYVLKPSVLLKGMDPRHVSRPQLRIGIGIISAQYLPKPDPGKDIIDPYVSCQIFGIPRDEWKMKTRTIKDNGFNPVWNESFERDVYCPELAVLRFLVKDFDSTSANDFVGEFSLPLSSVRPGYSSIRLNTGYGHTVDTSATLFVRIAIDKLG